MENVQTKATKMLSDMANAMIERDTWEWPPQCIIFSYQPVRPMRREQCAENHKEKISKK